jgi:hypothetical protein
VSRLAKFHHAVELRNRNSHTWTTDQALFTESQMAESFVRVVLRDRFRATLDGTLGPPLLDDLEKIVVDVIYRGLSIRFSQSERKLMEQLERCHMG